MPRRRLANYTTLSERQGSVMTDPDPALLEHYGADLTHARLIELIKLAEAAKPFYDWVVRQCQAVRGNRKTLTENLLVMSLEELVGFLRTCYDAVRIPTLPALFDGKGEKYKHRTACFYLFSWMLRDAPKQRLERIIARSAASPAAPVRIDVEIEALAKLFIAYRVPLGDFEWRSIREVVIDRLEGSRRALRGRRQEVVVRTAMAAALQSFYEAHRSYGRFASVDIPKTGMRVGTEEFDVVVNLLDAEGRAIERILTAVKTRETEGGGHSHLFTRDIDAAIRAVRASRDPYWIAAFIIAQNWSPREQEHVRDVCDFAVALPINPTAFESLGLNAQGDLNAFVDGLLSGRKRRKTIAPGP